MSNSRPPTPDVIDFAQFLEGTDGDVFQDSGILMPPLTTTQPEFAPDTLDFNLDEWITPENQGPATIDTQSMDWLQGIDLNGVVPQNIFEDAINGMSLGEQTTGFPAQGTDRATQTDAASPLLSPTGGTHAMTQAGFDMGFDPTFAEDVDKDTLYPTPNASDVQYGNPVVWQSIEQDAQANTSAEIGNLDEQLFGAAPSTPLSKLTFDQTQALFSTTLFVPDPISWDDPRRFSTRSSKSPPPRATTLGFERPVKNKDKAYVKINGKTEGKTKRSAKNNVYDADRHYKTRPPPLTNWKGSNQRKDFAYEDNGELTEANFSVKKLQSFIVDHPVVPATQCKNAFDPDAGKMVLWVQKAPADSARRYAFHSSKCRFSDCMADNRTIWQGHIRVAFDEKWNVYGGDTDPYLCAGFVHLYCLERFLNFADICVLPNVVVKGDVRGLTQEMDQRNKAALTGEANQIVSDFVDAATKGKRSNDNYEKLLKHFSNYPVFEEQKVNFKDSYKATVGSIIQEAYNRGRGAKVRENFARHMGDLEVYRAVTKEARKAGTQKRDATINKKLQGLSGSSSEVASDAEAGTSNDDVIFVSETSGKRPATEAAPGDEAEEAETPRRSSRTKRRKTFFDES